MVTRFINKSENRTRAVKITVITAVTHKVVFLTGAFIKDNIKNIENAGTRIMPAVPDFIQTETVSNEAVSMRAYEKSHKNDAAHKPAKETLTVFFLFFMKTNTARATAAREETYNKIC